MVAPEGVLVVVVQNHDTDCMRMLGHFFGHRFHLSELASRFEALQGRHYRVEIATVPAQVATADFDSAFIVAEFMLNVLPMPHPPPLRTLEEYVRKHFASSGGGFASRATKIPYDPPTCRLGPTADHEQAFASPRAGADRGKACCLRDVLGGRCFRPPRLSFGVRPSLEVTASSGCLF